MFIIIQETVVKLRLRTWRKLSIDFIEFKAESSICNNFFQKLEAEKLIPILILVVKIQIQNLFEKNSKEEVKLREKQVRQVVKIYIQKVAREVRSSFI